jgi:predicted nucleic acid-binding protein
MVAAADASPLILFARAGRLTLIAEVFDEVWIPPRVAGESFRNDPTRPGAIALTSVLGDWLREVPVSENALTTARAAGAGRGEAEAIGLALEHSLPLIIDDRLGRRAAQSLGVTIIGSAGVLLLAKRLGLLDEVRPTLDDLRAQGLRLSSSIYRQVLAAAGEPP